MPNLIRSAGLATLFSLVAAAAQSIAAGESHQLSCLYRFYGMDFATVAIRFDDGVLHDRATITHQGRSHTESIEQETPAVGESLRATISKESPENFLHMIVYEQRQPQGDSKLINPRIPAGREMWGDCQRQRME